MNSPNTVSAAHPKIGRGKSRRILRLASYSLALSTATLLVGAWWVGGQLVAPANQTIGPPPASLPFQEISLASASGATLAGWYLDGRDDQATVILLHPIRANRRAMLGRARLMAERGFSLLLIDFTAHGESTGNAISAGYHERHDVAAAVAYVRRRSPAHRIGVIGYSLGGASTLMAMPIDIDALVLESVYPTLRQAVHNRVRRKAGIAHHLLAPLLLAQMQPRLGFNAGQLQPIEHLGDVTCPVLIAVGANDQHTTLEESQWMFENAPSPKEFVVFPNAPHCDLHAFDSVRYEQTVIPFLNAALRR